MRNGKHTTKLFILLAGPLAALSWSRGWTHTNIAREHGYRLNMLAHLMSKVFEIDTKERCMSVDKF